MILPLPFRPSYNEYLLQYSVSEKRRCTLSPRSDRLSQIHTEQRGGSSVLYKMTSHTVRGQNFGTPASYLGYSCFNAYHKV